MTASDVEKIKELTSKLCVFADELAKREQETKNVEQMLSICRGAETDTRNRINTVNAEINSILNAAKEGVVLARY